MEERNRRMLRARDAMDRVYARPPDVAALAWIVHASPDQFIRTFRATFGETPHRYLQRRRLERGDVPAAGDPAQCTDICLDVGFTSLGTFSRTWRPVRQRDPDRAAHRRVTGNDTVKQAPPSGAGAAVIAPPMRVTSPCTSASPTPPDPTGRRPRYRSCRAPRSKTTG